MGLSEGIVSKTSAREFRGRLLLLIVLVAVAFILLATRLYYLQVVRGEEFT